MLKVAKWLWLLITFAGLGGLATTRYDCSISFRNNWAHCTPEPERWASSLQESYSKGAYFLIFVIFTILKIYCRTEKHVYKLFNNGCIILLQVVLDKNKPKIQTVVNKIDAIHNDYRTMQLEVLAGNCSLVTMVVENGLRFQVDLAKVYVCFARNLLWNSTEIFWWFVLMLCINQMRVLLSLSLV